MPTPTAKIIVNPTSGGGGSRGKWDLIQTYLSEAGLAYDWVFTKAPLDAEKLAADAVQHGYEMVVAVGGDGTVHEVLNGLMSGERHADLGIIQTGTANDYVRSLDLPNGLEAACRLLVSGRRREVDVGVVECTVNGARRSRFFANVAGAGFDGRFIEEVHKGPSSGMLGYALKFVRTIASYTPKSFVIGFDGEADQKSALTILVCNGHQIGTMELNPDGDITDGLFEVMAIGIPDVLLAVPVFLGVPGDLVKLGYWRRESITVVSDVRVPVQADGEYLGELPARFWSVPRALSVVG